MSSENMSFDKAIFASFAAGEQPAPEQIEAALTSILDGKAKDAQIGAFLLALEMKGITAKDIRVGAEVMRRHMTPVKLPKRLHENLIDIVGTGGTGLHTVSISTASAIVTAAAGAPVAKHGSRAASSLTGAADTLSELGVSHAISPALAAKAIKEIGLVFLFAPNHHPAMRHAAAARKSLGTRTIFNLLGPISNPAKTRRMLLGVSLDKFRRPIAEAMLNLGVDHIWVVHGSDGLDEITLTGPSYVSEVKDGVIRDFVITPQSFGFTPVAPAALKGGVPAENAAALTALLNGQTGPYRDIVLLNSGAALMLSSLVSTLPEGIKRAQDAIDSGKAKKILADLVRITNG